MFNVVSLYRFIEIIPGVLVWLTFGLIFFVSAKFPFVATVFLLLYSLFWFVRIVYLYVHLRVTFGWVRDNLKITWLDKIKEMGRQNGKSWQELYHLVILPMYKEPINVVQETFEVLLKCNYPKEKLIVVLATEESGGEEAKITARKIEERFGFSFLRFLTTSHPQNLPDEIPGKGSNETWAARASQKLIDELKIPYEDVIVSVFDIDTQAFPEYFGRLSYLFLTSPYPLRSSYQPVPLFINNIYDAPIFSRVMSFFPTFWQMMQQSRPEQLTTFTSQAMPLKALVDVDFWDTNLVSEDSLIFWKFYLHYNGDWRAIPMHYPVSLDANAAPTIWETAKNLYKQQRRWAWGTENIPYMITGFLKNKKIPLRDKIKWSLIFGEGFYSWPTTPFILFTLNWLPLILGGYDFNQTVLSYNLPKTIGIILNLATISLVASALVSTALLPPKPVWFRKRHYVVYFLQWFLVPILTIIFSAIPAIESQTRMMLGGKFRLGFWPTPKNR